MTATAVQSEKETTSTAVARRPSQVSLLRPIAPANEVIAAQNATRELIQQALKPDRDYGKIPGTNKATLYKAGAERTALAFGCYARFSIIESEIDHDRKFEYTKKGKPGVSIGLYRYVVECQIVDRQSGDVVGAFIGSCSSLESKYIDRPRDVENTVAKMAEKRALVGAVLTTFGLSDQFTQDLEDGSVEATEVEIVKDLAWAKAFGLPFPKHAHYNEPIDTRDTKELQGFLDWAARKIEESSGKGEEPSNMLIDFKAALTLILDDRKATAERDQTKLDLDSAAPKAETPGSTSVPVPPPGKVVDALEPKDAATSRKTFNARIKKALESPAIDVETRDAYHRDNVNGFRRPGKTLEWWVKRLEELAAADTTGPDQSFPEALKEQKDDLPF